MFPLLIRMIFPCPLYLLSVKCVCMHSSPAFLEQVHIIHAVVHDDFDIMCLVAAMIGPHHELIMFL